MLKKLITIEGMHCIHCASNVEKAIAELEGVKEAKVKLDKKLCTAKLSGEVSDSAVIDAVKNLGFEVISIVDKKSLF